MKFLKLLGVVIVTSIILGGCQSSIPINNSSNSHVAQINQQTLATTQSENAASSMIKPRGVSDIFTYQDLFFRDAQPTWKSINIYGVALSVPYSSEWKISDVGLSIYDIDFPVEKNNPVIRFGKPIDSGTSIDREYFLMRSDKKNLDILKTELTDGCDGHLPAELTSIGNIQGIKNYVGGAKGCSIGFAFNLGKYSYYIYRVADFGKATPEVSDEMKEIIKSIH